jgi:hypothetical protein
MGCPQCQHENRPDAWRCDQCGLVRPPTRARVPAVDLPGEPRARARPREIAAAFAVIAGGIAVIAGIVLTSPGWQKLFTARRESFASHDSTAKPGLAVAPPSRATRAPAAVTTAPAAQPLSLTPAARATDSARPVKRARPEAPHDMAQVMATVLIAQLGQDPAWRTALANAEAHAPDSPEHAYWGRVAAAIREGGIRLR